MMPDHHTLLFDQASNGGLGGDASAAARQALHGRHRTRNGRPGPLHQIWESGPADAPDGCALARRPHLPRPGRRFQPDRRAELERPGARQIRPAVHGYQRLRRSPSTLPPASTFGTQLVIANQSYFADNHHNQVLLDLQTGEAWPARLCAQPEPGCRPPLAANRPRPSTGVTTVAADIGPHATVKPPTAIIAPSNT